MIMLQAWYLRFLHLLFSVDFAVDENLDFMRMFFKFRDRLYAQMGVTSNGCLDEVSLL